MVMKPNIELDKKTIIIITSIALAGLIFLIIVWPLLMKVGEVSREAKALDEELAGFRNVLQSGSTFNREKDFMARNEISKGINEIVNIGSDFNINFLSTSPRPIGQPDGSKYPVLPIYMEVQSTYKDLGIFLGALENVSKNVVVVREFNIDRKPEILPKIQTELMVDIYLKEGEGG